MKTVLFHALLLVIVVFHPTVVLAETIEDNTICLEACSNHPDCDEVSECPACDSGGGGTCFGCGNITGSGACLAVNDATPTKTRCIWESGDEVCLNAGSEVPEINPGGLTLMIMALVLLTLLFVAPRFRRKQV